MNCFKISQIILLIIFLIPTTNAIILIEQMPYTNNTALLNSTVYKYNATNPSPAGMFPKYFHLEGLITNENKTGIVNATINITLIGRTISTFQLDDNTNRTYYDTKNITNYTNTTTTNENGYYYHRVDHAGIYKITLIEENISMNQLSYVYLDYPDNPETRDLSTYADTLSTKENDYSQIITDGISKTIISLGTGLIIAIPLVLILLIGVVIRWKKK